MKPRKIENYVTEVEIECNALEIAHSTVRLVHVAGGWVGLNSAEPEFPCNHGT